MKIWFTSDLHYFHRNVRRYCDRPFSSNDEMHAALIKNWNDRVEKNDTVYLLGDLFFCGRDKAIDVLVQLKGKKKWIPGNHDKGLFKKPELNSYIEHLLPLHEETFQVSGGLPQHVIMCHYPLHSWNRKHHGSIQLHGHVHSHDQSMNVGLNRYDVGVDANNYAPVSFEEIRQFFKDRT